MSDELFEVAFSGQIAEGADPDQVKAKIASMFKADEAKLAHLFSGKRVIIKKNIDQATANKYKTALSNAGAVCEIISLAAVMAEKLVEKPPEKAAEAVATKPAAPSLAPPARTAIEKPAPAAGNAPAAPQTDPLGISAEEISDLSAGIAAVGSNMQEEIADVAEPELDISGMDMAPAGSDLGQLKKEDPPPPPDTNGISLVD